MSPLNLRKILRFFILFSLLLSGCSIINNLQPTTTPTKIPTLLPTATPKPARVVLIAPPNSDAVTVTDAQKILTELASTSKLLFETRQKISANEITADIKIIVFLNHPDNLGALANAAPKTQFAVISDLNWNPTSNVTIIRQKPEYVAFIAGYISEVLDSNFRSGALIASEDTLTQDAFQNGAHFYCGLCKPEIPPYNNYPLLGLQPNGSPAASWQSAFDQINTGMIKVLYVAPEAYSPELFTYLVSKDIILFGSQIPPDVAKPKWAATLQLDELSPLREAWPDLIAGKGGKTIYGGVQFADLQLNLFPQGKVDFIDRMLDKMRSGLINPLSVPKE